MVQVGDIVRVNLEGNTYKYIIRSVMANRIFIAENKTTDLGYYLIRNGDKWVFESNRNIEVIIQENRSLILESYNEIVNSSIPCESFPLDVVQRAASGMFINPRGLKEKPQKELCGAVYDSRGKEPFVHEDSMTAWGNKAVECGLTVGDITSMKFGDRLEAIFLDRNVGDAMHGTKSGFTYNPTEKGLTHVSYIPGEGLSGILQMKDTLDVQVPFTWEINLAALGDENSFWGPIKNGEKLNPDIQVGWRGPAIRLADAQKYLPSLITHYDTWWDDYLIFREHNLLKLKSNK